MQRHVLSPALTGVAAALLLLSATSTGVNGQTGTTPPQGVVAIRNATLLTVTRGTIASGTIVLSGGKITAIGANAAIPAGADVVDGTGMFVAPGIIDCHSHIANDAINEGSVAVSSMTGMEDVLDATDINIYRDLAGGTTSANILHGSANPIGGKSLVIKLRWGATRPSDLVFQGAPPGIKFALGENVTRKRGLTPTPPERFPTTRQGVEYVMRDAFTRAKAYQAEWRDYTTKKASGADLLAPRRDLQLDALVEILEGKRLVHAHSYRADEILMLIRLADELGFKITTFQHVLEGYKVAKEIAAHGAGASTFSDWWGYKMEAADAIPYNAAIMAKKGVLVSINSDDADQARRLNIEAAKVVRYGGLTDDEALAMVTINPAKQLKIDARVGSLEVGKDADVVLWNHHPLSTTAIVERAYIDGRLYFDRAKDAARPTPAPGNGAPAASATTQTPASTPARSAADPFDVKTNANGPTWAITNARIVTVSGPEIARGTVVIKGNRIEAVGANVSVPSGAKVVDAAGASVYPGLIDTSTDIGLNEPGVRNYDDVSDILTFGQALRTRVAYKADSVAIPVARAEGVTTIAVRPAGGLISGEVPVMNLDGWTWEEATLRPSSGLALNFPGGGGRGGGGGAATGPNAQLTQLADLLARARTYAKQPAASRAVDWNLEPLLPLLDGRQALYVAATGDAAVRQAVGWAEQQGVRVVIRGNADIQRSAAFLKQHDVPVILSTVFTLPPREDDVHSYTFEAPAALAKAGVVFGFSSGGYQFARDVPFQAGRAIGWGLSKDDAIKALTINAAKVLGVDRYVGSIEAGKIANLIVVKGDPTEIRSQMLHVVIAGRDVGLDTRHTELYRKYLARQ
jgi:imidazolonepropionase-like amidohydrolase